MRLELCKPAEIAIYNAMQEVEKMPPDVRLTNAVIKLAEAKNLVADFIDDAPFKENKPEDGERLEMIIDLKDQLIKLLEEQVNDYKELVNIKSNKAKNSGWCDSCQGRNCIC